MKDPIKNTRWRVEEDPLYAEHHDIVAETALGSTLITSRYSVSDVMVKQAQNPFKYLYNITEVMKDGIRKVAAKHKEEDDA